MLGDLEKLQTYLSCVNFSSDVRLYSVGGKVVFPIVQHSNEKGGPFYIVYLVRTPKVRMFKNGKFNKRGFYSFGIEFNPWTETNEQIVTKIVKASEKFCKYIRNRKASIYKFDPNGGSLGRART